jgi:predicted secreted protein
MQLLLAVLVSLTLLVGAKAAEQKPITVNVGQEFELVLETPPGNNHQWLLSSPLDESKLKQAGREYVRRHPSVTSGRGCEVLRYKAVGEGKIQISLKYAPLFEKSATPVATTNVVVIINKAK